jgi:inhibitor of cysteine peptidase
MEMTEEVISVAEGEKFDITLEENPTTGYLWEATFENSILELEGKDYQSTAMAMGAGGRGGKAVFTFHAKGFGETELTFKLQRSWEGVAVKTKVFRIVVTQDRGRADL